MMPSDPKPPLACLTLDLEEDYAGVSGALIYEGLAACPEILDRLKSKDIPLTVFVSGNFLEQKGSFLDPYRALEFHSHGYNHLPHHLARQPEGRRSNIKEGLRVFKEFFGRIPLGYRAPFGMLQESDFPFLAEQGIRFDSSFFPGLHVSGFHPFRNEKPKRYAQWNLMEIPISPVPILKLPYSFSYVQMLGDRLYRWMGQTFKMPDPLVFNFHLHDLAHTSTSDRLSPFWQKVYAPKDLKTSLAILERLLDHIREQGYRFVSMSQIYQEHLTGKESA